MNLKNISVLMEKRKTNLMRKKYAGHKMRSNIERTKRVSSHEGTETVPQYKEANYTKI